MLPVESALIAPACPVAAFAAIKSNFFEAIVSVRPKRIMTDFGAAGGGNTAPNFPLSVNLTASI